MTPHTQRDRTSASRSASHVGWDAIDAHDNVKDAWNCSSHQPSTGQEGNRQAQRSADQQDPREESWRFESAGPAAAHKDQHASYGAARETIDLQKLAGKPTHGWDAFLGDSSDAPDNSGWSGSANASESAGWQQSSKGPAQQALHDSKPSASEDNADNG